MEYKSLGLHRLAIIAVASAFAACSARNGHRPESLDTASIESLEKSDDLIAEQLLTYSQSKLSREQSRLFKFSGTTVSREPLTIVMHGNAIKRTLPGKTDLSFSIVRELMVYIHRQQFSPTQMQKQASSHHQQMLCVFDSYLSTDENTAESLSLFGAPVNGTYGLRKRTLVRQLSKPSTIETDTSYSAMAVQCEQVFQRELQTKNATIMSSFADNFSANIPKKDCTLPSAQIADGGDESCMDWFHEQFPGLSRTAVPRCEKIDGIGSNSGFCTVRAKYMTQCPIFLSRSLTYREVPEDETIYLASNPEKQQFFCDPLRNLVCRARKDASDRTFAVAGHCELP